MFFAKILLFATLTIAANALTTPLVARHAHQHHAIAARFASSDESTPTPPAPLRKRSTPARCRPKTTSSSLTSTSPTSTPSPAPAPVNAEPNPPSSFPTTSSTPKTTQPAEEPKATPAPAPSPTTSKAAPPATTSQSSGGSGGGGDSGLDSVIHTGDGTFYETGLGACGITNVDTDFIAAIAHDDFDSFPGYDGVNPNNNPICGKKVIASYQGNSVTVTLTDRCGGCDGDSLDFSPSAFSQLANQAVGRIHGMTWHYID